MLDLTTACVIDACCYRIDAVHEALGSLLMTVVRFHGAESPVPGFHGMHPMTLFRTIDAAMRSYSYFCKRRTYAQYMQSVPDGAVKPKDTDA